MDFHRFCFVLFISMIMLWPLTTVRGQSRSNETDRDSLLDFMRSIPDDPDHVFSSWNDTVDFCSWPGVTCGRRHSRVTRLELPSSRLGGSLSPSIGNLTFLNVLNINDNGFSSNIPPEIGNLRRLTYLGLENNSFSGQIPENISGCVDLRVIRLGNSILTGGIPQGMAALLKLQTVLIFKNNLSGTFPEFFGNFSSLVYISGSLNNFAGAVPASLGRLRNLNTLYLGGNQFSGTLPLSIFNITSLEYIQFPANQLDGTLPPNIGITLPNLIVFNFADNLLTGPIPPTIANATNLMRLTIPLNNFTGSVPDLKNLNILQWVSISENQLGSGVEGDLRFVETLNSSDLQLLAISMNNFGGNLPQSIGNLSSQLSILSVEINRFTGTIPSSIGNLHNLEILYIGTNQFTGILPDEIGNLYQLTDFRAQKNRFTGMIPHSLGNLTMLTQLRLAGNNFHGIIPASLGNCVNLLGLDLSSNNLTGTVPSEVLSISSLTIVLDLSQNKLNGSLPNEIGNLNQLTILNLEGNKLSGQVPKAIGECTSLVGLYLRENSLEGGISSFLSPLRGLQYLDISQNNFSGEIPKFLADFHLTYLNLSFNHFDGEVPSQGVFSNATGISVMGNGILCGGSVALNLPSCLNPISKSGKRISSAVIISIISGSVVLFVSLLLLATHRCMKKNRRNENPQSGLVQIGPFMQVSYEDILRATEGLDKKNLIGAGSFGSVYKGILGNDGHVVAIKIIDLKNRAASKSFLAECEALRNIRHRNLVKTSTACSTIDHQGNDFKALVYEYMENGSLEDWLHPKVASGGASKKLSLIKRLGIAIDIASAVEYLHHECETLIIHCDLKPSNVLLDADMIAHVGDFGIARILSTDEVVLEVSSIGVRGTIGYSPPEYGMGSQVSREGDVYSYGILLLEMFTGKRPTDGMFEGAWNIRSYCEAALTERVSEIADPYLFSDESIGGSIIRAPRMMVECLAKVFEIGIRCCGDSPGERMDIREAAAELRSIKASV